MTDDEHDRWASDQIKDEFQKNAKDHLNKKFNKQDQDRIHLENIKRLKKEYLELQRNTRKAPKLTQELKHSKGYMRKIKNTIAKEEQLKFEKKIQKRKKEIEQEIKERQQELEQTRDRQR